jgi:GNAT superfamily N-acetyltransferase
VAEPSPPGEVEIRTVALEDVLPTRRRVLRPHQRIDEVAFDGDRRHGAAHVAALVDGRVIGVASVVPQAHPDGGAPGAWRIRGMAVDDDRRGRGIGGRLLERCLAHARANGAQLVWCNARVRAVPFYERHGFEREGAAFDVPHIGPHVRMRLLVL